MAVISGLSQKNVQDTCCIDIKPMADKGEEGRDNDCGEKPIRK